MNTPFPGMDPYLERRDIWSDVHNSLIASLRDSLALTLRPRYYVSIEERTYLSEPPGLDSGGLVFAGRPDVAVVSPLQSTLPFAPAPVATTAPAGTLTVELPIPDRVRETYLEVRAVDTSEVVTVLEILSPTNKRPGRGRRLYERKRLNLLGTLTHLVEVDLLRGGEPMTMWGNGQASHYRILISRSERRPQARLYAFNVRQPIPSFVLPLRHRDEEPMVDLGDLLHDLYERAGYDMRIDYRSDPEPALEAPDDVWADALLRQAGLR